MRPVRQLWKHRYLSADQCIVSIYSHLLGSALFYAMPYYFWTYVYKQNHEAEFEDFLAFSVFFLSVATCFLLSSA